MCFVCSAVIKAVIGALETKIDSTSPFIVVLVLFFYVHLVFIRKETFIVSFAEF